MKGIFKKYLFEKHILVNDYEEQERNNYFYVLFALANKTGIEITSGQELAHISMLRFASDMLGTRVPEPFYRGFPETVRKLTKEQLTFDQLFHYFTTYTMGDFDEAGHSVMEESFRKTAFQEDVTPKKFQIVDEETATKMVYDIAISLTKSSRPLSKEQYELLLETTFAYGWSFENIASLDTIVKLIYDTKEDVYLKQIKLSDVIKLADYINYSIYNKNSLKKLNLMNKDRKLISNAINRAFETGKSDIRVCYEKKDLWCGLLHHLHYKPRSKEQELFLQAMRGKENKSVYSKFEALMRSSDIKGAVNCLVKEKGAGALVRKLDYIASRSENLEDSFPVIRACIQTKNPLLLIQLLMHYSFYKREKARIFRFTKHNMVKTHVETNSEWRRRKSYLKQDTVEMIKTAVYEQLKVALKDKLGKVYIDEAMKKVALPLQETTSNGGFGVLPKGTRLPMEDGKIIRAFTYWSKVNDIDLSCLAFGEELLCPLEYSWRTMRVINEEGIVFSGDQTSGFNGGSEYFDIDLEAYRKNHPDVEYMVFCDNVYSGVNFGKIECRAGYMLRDKLSSGEVYEPKTVKSSFNVNCDSTFAYMYALDFKTNEFVWLNIAVNSCGIISATEENSDLQKYMCTTDIINVYDFFTMLASEVVDNPEDADVVVSDKELVLKEGVEQIHSYNFEKIMELMN